MSTTSGEINHVSDTALMVAACRAHENELEDAYFRDPFAARLAGERGRAILEAMPYANVVRFGLAIRTRFIDELLLEALSVGGITAVLSVGCGLDTRPWRLDLPADLRWVEVDFADVLDYKEQVMSAETPHCRRERLSADLNDDAQRQLLYKAAGTPPSLMITEGLLLYLPAATVQAIAAGTRDHTHVRQWISDITTSAFSKAMGRTDAMSPIRHVQAPDCLQGEEVVELLARHGWITETKRSYITDVAFARDRVLRLRGGATPPPIQFPPNDPTGVHRFVRS